MIDVQAGQAELLGVLRERHGMAALGGRATDLVGHQLRVPQGHDRHRDEPLGVRAGPLVDVPVVVGAHTGERQILVLRTQEQLAAEVDERGEVDRTEHAVGVHVAHPLVHVVAARSHLVVAQWVEPVLLRRAAGDGVEPHVLGALAFEQPELAAGLVFCDPWRLVAVLLGDVGVEHRRRLDDVVVDTDQDHVVGVHGKPPLVAEALAAEQSRI